jgi:hypothetical protein
VARPGGSCSSAFIIIIFVVSIIVCPSLKLTSRSKQVRFLVPLSPPPEDVMEQGRSRHEQGRSRTRRERIVTTQDQPREKLRCGSGSSWNRGHLIDLGVEFNPRRVISFDSILHFPPEEWTPDIRDRMSVKETDSSHCSGEKATCRHRCHSSATGRQL